VCISVHLFICSITYQRDASWSSKRLLHGIDLKKSIRLADGIFTVENYRHLAVNDVPVIITSALRVVGFQNVNIFSFLRLKVGKFLFVSESYSAGFKTCSSVCQNLHNNVSLIGIIHNNVSLTGIIKSVVRVSRCGCVRQCRCEANCYAIVEQLATESAFIVQGPVAPFSLPYIFKYTRSRYYVAVDVQLLQSVFWNVYVDDDCFAALVVNNHELE